MELEESIKEMIIEDQNIQKLIIKNDKYEIDSLENRKKEIIKKNCDNCKNILNNYGYPTIDLVSKKHRIIFGYWCNIVMLILNFK